jgi:hypothetical protein
MIRGVFIACLACSASLAQLAAQEPSVRIEPPQLQGSRPVEKQTEASVIRDYLQSWKTLDTALNQNDPSALDASFVGTARDKIADTIDEQTKLGIHARYTAQSHDLQIVFYSPEGSSIQLIDTVDYHEQVMDHDKVLADKPVHERYVIVLTPSQVSWRVRIFQADVQ